MGEVPSGAFQVALPTFEGPLDLLLHLIRAHKVDIFDIPIALIAEKYRESLEWMQDVNLDVAGEFLVMAATLAHIKSQLLLPRTELSSSEPDMVEDGDPRAELVRRLLEYQKYKEAGRVLAQADILDRDVFARRIGPSSESVEPAALVEVSVYKLIEALDRVLQSMSPEAGHEVTRERVTLSVAMERIAGRMRGQPEVSFLSLFEGQTSRYQVVVTFLALLEMVKLRLVRVHQPAETSDIFVSASGDLRMGSVPEVNDGEYS